MMEIDPDISIVEKILEKKVPHHIHSYDLDPKDNIELNLRMGNNMLYFANLWTVDRKETLDAEGRLNYIDGKVDNLIPGFIEMEVDVLNPIDPSDGSQDIFEIKKKYGDKITLCGNIDINSILKDGTPDEVNENVIYHIQFLGKGGGYILASSYDFHQLIPVENFYTMRDAVVDFCLQ